ncbi:5'-methylthioadenosine/S-adenosylhomocysteine nucleosidase [Romboutsia lituseburensis]|uniref:5'-methylthioadenosine/S-adenosylhomocysteine nucleosidase n=1 Tax=Romboutsia lituseburensis TaxID=1537 RepID=UPI003B50BEE2
MYNIYIYIYHIKEGRFTIYKYKFIEVPLKKEVKVKSGDTFEDCKSIINKESIKFNYHIGKIVSGESFISDCNLRNLIIKEHSPHCVEMEGSAIGHVAYINSIPFRSISDNADDNAANSIIDFEKISANNSALLVLNILDILDKAIFFKNFNIF